KNPFVKLPTQVRGNDQRMYFLSQADADKVIDKCPDSQWKLLFVLSRYAGLRCPSEHLALRWGDVEWGQGDHGDADPKPATIPIRSPKPARHADGGIRMVPMFPELRPKLEAVFNEFEAANGRPPSKTDFVITRYRDSNINLRSQLIRFITLAKLK